jgi:hypothetical protein
MATVATITIGPRKSRVEGLLNRLVRMDQHRNLGDLARRLAGNYLLSG